MFDSSFEHLTTNAVCDGTEYYISTNNTPDAGLETMIFEVRPTGEVMWGGIYCERHSTAAEAKMRHEYICANLKGIIELARELERIEAKAWEQEA